MTDCCKSGPKTKMCTRKSDKKTFTFPRRFSKKHCLTKKIKGFTMRASCAPFKDCKKGGKFDKHRNIEKDSYENALEKPQMNFPLTDDAFFEQSSSSYDLNENRPDVSINLDDSSLFSNLPDDDISLYGLPEDPDEILNIPMEADEYDELFEAPPSPIRRQRGGKRKNRKNKVQKAGGKWYPDEKFAKAIKDEDLETIQDDIKKGVDINVRLPDLRFKPIHVAVNTGNLDIVKLLLDNGASINMEDTEGYTPLHHVASRKKKHDSMEINAKLIDIANLLIDRGANMNIYSDTDDTPLDLAARNGDLEMVELLINKGANLDYSEKALHYASGNGHLPMVKYLVKRGYPVNKLIGEIRRETPLDRAVKKDHYDVVRYLVVVGGANINAVTLNRIGHFELNSSSPRLEIAKFLIRAVVKEGKGDVRLEDIKYSRPVRELYIEALNLPKLEGTKIPKEMSKFEYRGGKGKTRKNKTTKKRRKKQTRKKKRKN